MNDSRKDSRRKAGTMRHMHESPTQPAPLIIPEVPSSREKEIYEARLAAAHAMLDLLERDATEVEKPTRLEIHPLTNYTKALAGAAVMGGFTPEKIKEAYGSIFFDKDETLLFPENRVVLTSEMTRMLVKDEILGSGIVRVLNHQKELTGAGLHTLGTMLKIGHFNLYPDGQYIIPGMFTINSQGKWCVLSVWVSTDENKNKETEFYLKPLDEMTIHAEVVLNFAASQ